jgi:predicted metal-dependent phosphoesterase TrpH
LIDLHTHTTASDGRCAPAELVARASAAGVTVLAVTDHDTVAGCAAVSEACGKAGIEFVTGIEITAVVAGGDVHVLGYFVDVTSDRLQTFLAEQRGHRADRVRQIVARLASAGITLDADEILRPGVADTGKAPGRPWVARALVAAGHVATADQAFDRWLERGRPGYVERIGPSPSDVFARIHDAGGVASLAHPVLVGHDDWLSGFAEAGMDALEAYHPEHDRAITARYLGMARALKLAVSGGSDYHGDKSHGPAGPGSVSLPPEEFARLKERAKVRLKPDSTRET